MPNGKKDIRRFVVKVGDTYYMTTGPLLTYNMEAAGDNARKREGVDEIARMYKEEHDKPHTFYEAVSFNRTDFSGINTGQNPPV